MAAASGKREPKPFSAGVNARVVGMLTIFVLVICATVIVTDSVSPRPRHPAAMGATSPAWQGAGSQLR